MFVKFQAFSTTKYYTYREIAVDINVLVYANQALKLPGIQKVAIPCIVIKQREGIWVRPIELLPMEPEGQKMQCDVLWKDGVFVLMSSEFRLVVGSLENLLVHLRLCEWAHCIHARLVDHTLALGSVHRMCQFATVEELMEYFQIEFVKVCNLNEPVDVLLEAVRLALGVTFQQLNLTTPDYRAYVYINGDFLCLEAYL